MLVSVIMPTFNHRSFLRDAVRSALSQTHKEIELLVVDDGSSYDVQDLLGVFRDPRLKLLHLDGRGPSGAINCGISAASGEAIALTSGDDLSRPDRVETQLRALGRRQRCMLFSVPEIIDASGEKRDDGIYPAFIPGPQLHKVEQKIRHLFYHLNYICAPSAFGRRADFAHVGSFHEGLWQLQDFEYWIRCLKAGVSLDVHGQRIVSYRWMENGSNLSGVANQGRIEAELAYVFKSFLSGFDPMDLCRAFAQETFAVLNDPAETVRMNAPLWALSHGRQAVRQIGYEGLIELTVERQARERLEAMDLSPLSISNLVGRW